uniref:Integrase catalytic domain-containing protein n=1 Tax=Glossina austeni TaxID=7395 RepID=A0A1A9VK78_GLOAU
MYSPRIKFTYVELHKRATKPIAAEFLRNLIKILPHTVLTDNGIQFTNQKRHKYAFQHIFDREKKKYNNARQNKRNYYEY